MPDRVFQQEYLAAFVDDVGSVFSEIRSRTVAEYSLPAPPAESADPFAIGVDFARFEDWTVAVVLNADGRLVAFDRLQQTTWTRIQNVIERLASMYTPNTVALDATRDNKIVQDLEDGGLNVDAVTFSGGSKRTLIENLITAQEAGELTISSEATTLITELELYEFETSDAGRIRYGAPAGFHDDCVDALALAVSADDPPKRSIGLTW